MANVGVVLEDVMNDALLIGSLAAGIFVKNTNSQAIAANVIKSVALLLQVIDAQLNPTPAAATALPAAVPAAAKAA